VNARAQLIERIEGVLPQTQCGQCGFEGCTPYAEALADKGADCDRCPPGGDAVAAALASLCAVTARPFDRARGEHLPPRVAVVREEECIGCTKCIQACPIDAIVGAAQRMHTVMTNACSGCGLCLPPCPVDCIDLADANPLASPQGVDSILAGMPAERAPRAVDTLHAARALRDLHADRWRQRHDARTQRLQVRETARQRRLAKRDAVPMALPGGLPPAVVAALAVAARRLAESPPRRILPPPGAKT